MPHTRVLSAWFLGVLFIIVPATIFAQNPTSREYPYIYKSPRAMGMGGVYTAIGGRVDTLFYNPAGLINIPRDKGWEVNILNPTMGYGEKTERFVKDMQDAFNTEDKNNDGSKDDDQLRAVNDILANYRGENLHAAIADFTSFGKSYENFAFGLGEVVNLRLDGMTHQGFGSEGLLEMNSDLTYGPIGGISYRFRDNLFAGLSLKLLHRESIIHNFTAREFVEKQDNLDKYIMDELKTSGDAFGFDIGTIWKFAQSSWIKPSLGVSMMNVGDLSFGKAGKVPMTVNIGVAANPAISIFRSLVVGVDYIDVTNNYTQDKDMAKRLRYGGELQLFDIWPAEMAVRAGMYQGYPTFGADFRLLILAFTYTMYSEEVGAYAGQDKDTRHVLTLTMGW